MKFKNILEKLYKIVVAMYLPFVIVFSIYLAMTSKGWFSGAEAIILLVIIYSIVFLPFFLSFVGFWASLWAYVNREKRSVAELLLIIVQPIAYACVLIFVDDILPVPDILSPGYFGGMGLFVISIFWLIQAVFFTHKKKILSKEYMPETPDESKAGENLDKKKGFSFSDKVLALVFTVFTLFVGASYGVIPAIDEVNQLREEREYDEWYAENVKLVYSVECSLEEINVHDVVEFKIYIRNEGKEAFDSHMYRNVYFRKKGSLYGGGLQLHRVSPVGVREPILEPFGEPSVLVYNLGLPDEGKTEPVVYELILSNVGEEVVLGEYTVYPKKVTEDNVEQ